MITLPKTLSQKLLHCPLLYARLMRLKRNWNQEKYVYLHLLQQGDTLIEGGANIGYYTRLFTDLVGPSGSVHAFEPTEQTFQKLRALSKTHLAQGTLHLNQLGLSSQGGSTEIYLPGDDSGQASLKRHHTGSWKNAHNISAHTIKLTTLDDYTASNHIAMVNFIKLDIEGAELEALEGSQASLRRWTPLLHLEVSSAWLADYNHSPKDLVDYLTPLGYDSFFVYDNHMQAPVDLRHYITEDESISGNVVCAVYDKHEARLKRLKWQRQKGPKPPL